MQISNSFSFLLGPLVAVMALGVIVLLCRWVFSTSTRDARTAAEAQRASARGDYGLLVPIATVRTRDDGEMLRSVLGEAGIRCTVTESVSVSVSVSVPPGSWTVLVFRADALRARDLVSS